HLQLEKQRAVGSLPDEREAVDLRGRAEIREATASELLEREVVVRNDAAAEERADEGVPPSTGLVRIQHARIAYRNPDVHPIVFEMGLLDIEAHVVREADLRHVQDRVVLTADDLTPGAEVFVRKLRQG